MISPEQVDQLLHTLAAHPVLPSMDRLPANDEVLHALLAELAAGERSRYAERVGRVATEAGITPEELARRAEFLLACLILPRADTYYEMLGVVPTATPEEIRKRWATLIQRYHPDHFDRGDGWVSDQARRLIEAYQTLRDPERRRRYDAALACERASVTEQRRQGRIRQLRGKPWPRRRWMPPLLMGVGLAGFIGVYLWRPPQPLPQAALPPAPKLLEGWQRPALLNPAVFSSSPRPTPPAEGVPEPEPVPSEMPEQSQEPAPESDSQTTHMSEAQTPQEMPTLTVTQHETSSAVAITRVLRTLTEPDGSPLDATPIPPRKSPPRPALEAPPPATEPPQFQKERWPTAKLEGSLAEKVPTVSPKVVSTPPAPVVSIEPDRTAGRAVPARVAPSEDDPLSLIETFRAAYERKDLGAMMRLFVSAPKEREAVGRSAVQALYARNFDGLDQIQYELTELETMAPASTDSLVVQGWFHIRAIRRDNPSQLVDAAGPVRWVLRREADALRIAEIYYVLSR
jgi:DnaJ-domain-containing protein 1/ketosteroid isomerase-like protein